MTDNANSLRLSPEQLRRQCDPEKFTFKDTSEIDEASTIYGQPRGLRAIEFGIDIGSSGYNIYVLGPTGSGRVTAIRHFIDERAQAAPTPHDWCYVHNFKQPHMPQTLRMPAGMGRRFKGAMETLILTLREEIPGVFEGENYLKARTEITSQLNEARQTILKEVQQLAEEMSLAIQHTPQGAILIVPIAEGKPITQEDYEKLSEEARTSIMENRQKLEESIDNAFRATRILQVQADEALDHLRREIAQQLVDAHIGEVLKDYDLIGEVIQYIWAVQADILDSLDVFELSAAEEQQEKSDDPEVAMNLRAGNAGEHFNRYTVNVFVENEPDSGAPVLVLDLPTYQNLVGRIEHEIRFGVMSTDFTQLKSGGLHRANGGFLLIRTIDILRQPFAWDALKRALNTGQVMIEDPESRGTTVMATQHLEPEPIPLENIKVILVGSADLYYTLHAIDEDFRDLFRVKADFDDTMERSEEAELQYATFIATHCRRENLLHFDRDAVARMVDYGSWQAAEQSKLSTKFGQILPLMRESSYYARKNGHDLVTAADVKQAVQERIYRNNELEEHVQERITRGLIYIDVEGEVVGQINGLAVMSLGDHMFGLPGRITARVFMGRDSVVQIDRESEMTGPIHDKGVMILEGYLGGRYAQNYPLTLTTTLTFEQNYGGVEGDSASSTELYALLSALSGLPIRQDLAVTGSVNQRGQIQPIGGVTQKIEGFFNTCKARGLSGTQGVLIPKSNVPDLMINDEVMEAVKDGKFHVYAVSNVDEGIALLTGQDAETVHAAVDKRLRELAENLVSFEEGSKDDDGEESEGEGEAAG